MRPARKISKRHLPLLKQSHRPKPRPAGPATSTARPCTWREDGSYSGVPTLAQCLECHEEVNGEDPEEALFVNEFVANDREVPWRVYSRQPQNVFFSHAAHVKMAEMDCVTCHGPIGESESLPVYKENRISGYSIDIWGRNISGIKRNSWDRMKMDDCAECHRNEGVNQNSVQTQRGGCFVCHH